MNAASIAFVIPSRNRSALAINACESLLAQTGCKLHVFVSDNSTDPNEAKLLADYCARGPADRLTYLRPAEPLAMGKHWDWALRTAVARSDATHFNVHYDRRLTKPDHVRLVCDVIAAFPGDVITWTLDQVLNDTGRSVVWQTPWDGRVYRIQTARIVQMTARGRVSDMGQAFPILSNCAIPRSVLSKVIQQFGDICDSTAPDSCFTFRFCATHDSYVHFDRPVGIVYASHRSTGWGYLKGGAGGDFPDFRKSWGETTWLAAAPIPELNLGQNMLFHEYELVRRATDNPVFEPLDYQSYLRELGLALRWVQDPDRAADFRRVLIEHGWNPNEPAASPLPELRFAAEESSRARRAVRHVLRTSIARVWPEHKRGWMRATLFAAKHFKVAPDHICGFEFDSDDEGLRHAIELPRKPYERNPLLEPLGPQPA